MRWMFHLFHVTVGKKVLGCVDVVTAMFMFNYRYDDQDSASSSFSILLGDAPHLDEKA